MNHWKKRYWKEIIVNGKNVPWMCDGTMPIIPEVRNLYTDEEWNDILYERRKCIQELKNIIKELDK